MIDWFTVAAQLINFLILIALLKYFLYGRILAAMDQRQATIESAFHDATQSRDSAERELADARQKKHDIDEQREQMLNEARQEVEEFRKRLTAEVRTEIEELKRRWATSVEEETDSFLSDLKRRLSESICQVARQALSDLAGTTLESQIVEQFLQRIRHLDDVHRKQVVESLLKAKGAMVVQTSLELQSDQMTKVATTLKNTLLSDMDVQFETSDDLLCGIALQTNSHTLAWDLRDFLNDLEQELRVTLEEEVSSKRGTRIIAMEGSN